MSATAPQNPAEGPSRPVEDDAVMPIEARVFGFTGAFARRVPTLYLAGDLDLLAHPTIALIGSRQASEEGLERAAAMAEALVNEGVVVMSGLARGIDAAAHRAALAHGGRTLAVLGTPLDRAYPSEHAELQAHIARHHLVLSPFAPGTRTVPAHFPLRNRVMARLAWATVVLEASDTSGALHQVNECLRIGSPVWLPRAVAENPATSWPARYLSKPRVYVFDHPYEVTERLEDALEGR